MYAFILAFLLSFIFGSILGYLLGRYQSTLANRIRTLQEQARQVPAPPPTKPAVVSGAYQPPKEVSTSVDDKQKAGLVETKTPERLDWENKNEIEELSKI